MRLNSCSFYFTTFSKGNSLGRNDFNEKEEMPITPSKYVLARLKCSDDGYAANPHLILHALDQIKRNAVVSPVYFTERKQENSKGIMMSNDQIFSSLKKSGTSQYLHNMLLDVLAKIRQYGDKLSF